MKINRNPVEVGLAEIKMPLWERKTRSQRLRHLGDDEALARMRKKSGAVPVSRIAH